MRGKIWRSKGDGRDRLRKKWRSKGDGRGSLRKKFRSKGGERQNDENMEVKRGWKRQVEEESVRDCLSMKDMLSLYIYIYIVKVTSARCDSVPHTPMTIFRQVQRTVGFGFYKF